MPPKQKEKKMNYDKKINVSLSVMELEVLKQFLNDNVMSSDFKRSSLIKIKNKLNNILED